MSNFGEHGHVSWHRGLSRVQKKQSFRAGEHGPARAPRAVFTGYYLQVIKQERPQVLHGIFRGNRGGISGSLKKQDFPGDDILRP